MTVKGTLPRGFRPPKRVLVQRQLLSVRMMKAGYTTDQIAGAMGVHDATVRKDLYAQGVRSPKRQKTTLPDPEPVDWLHLPVSTREPTDRVAVAIDLFLAEMGAARYAAAHASDLLGARREGNRDWTAAYLQKIAWLREIVSTLERQHADEAFLRASALGRPVKEESEGVDELRHRGGGIMQPVVGVMNEPGGPGRLGGNVEHDEENDRPRDYLLEHVPSVTPSRLIANSVRQ